MKVARAVLTRGAGVTKTTMDTGATSSKIPPSKGPSSAHGRRTAPGRSPLIRTITEGHGEVAVLLREALRGKRNRPPWLGDRATDGPEGLAESRRPRWLNLSPYSPPPKKPTVNGPNEFYYFVEPISEGIAFVNETNRVWPAAKSVQNAFERSKKTSQPPVSAAALWPGRGGE